MAKFKTKFLSLFLITSISLNMVPFQVMASSRFSTKNKKTTSSQKKLKNIKNEIAQNKNNQKKLDELSKKVQNEVQKASTQLLELQKEIKIIKEDIEKKQKDIAILNGKLTENKEAIKNLENRIAILNKEIEKIKGSLGEVVAKQYCDFKSGGGFSPLMALSSNASMGDMIKKQEYISAESDQANDLINNFTTQSNEMQKNKQELEKRRKNGEELEKRSYSEINILRGKENALNKKNIKMREHCATLSNNLSTIQNKTAEMKKAGEVLQKQQEVLSRYHKESKNQSNQEVASPETNDVQRKRSKSAPAGSLSGKFCFPVPSGRVSSPFGQRRRGYSHKGVDICAPKGTPIRGAGDGTVIAVGHNRPPYSGYGHCVEIDHGNGVRTLYGHMNDVKVKPGQQIQQGQNIGSVGNSGDAGVPHCHFEVRKGGQKVNPSSYY